jgi:hypothetical protein
MLASMKKEKDLLFIASIKASTLAKTLQKNLP